jgi:hypothetical protein
MLKTLRQQTTLLATCATAMWVFATSAFAAQWRIYIPPSGQGQAHAYMSGYSSRVEFVLLVHKAQRLSLRTTQGGPTVVTVVYANGQSEGAPGGIAVNIQQTADVQIVVTEHKMASPWSGSLTLEVSLK